MDLNRLTRDADDLIRKVVSRYNQLYVPAGNISQLELDLMLDDLRKLYDTFKHIGHINLSLQDTINKTEVKVNSPVLSDSQPAASATSPCSENQFISPEPVIAAPQPQQETVVITETEPENISEPVNISEPENKSEPEIDLPDEAEEELVQESEIEPEPAQNIQVEAAAEIPDMDVPVQKKAEYRTPVITEQVPATLADRFNTGSKSLSETMATSQAKSGIGSRLQFQPIADLNTGIGLNDKFSFISDLFGNSAVQYDEAIHRINKAVNLDEANWILQKYHSSDWEQKPESLSRLKDFVKRRFI